jgi:hypothetical protein
MSKKAKRQAKEGGRGYPNRIDRRRAVRRDAA